MVEDDPIPARWSTRREGEIEIRAIGEGDAVKSDILMAQQHEIILTAQQHKIILTAQQHKVILTAQQYKTMEMMRRCRTQRRTRGMRWRWTWSLEETMCDDAAVATGVGMGDFQSMIHGCVKEVKFQLEKQYR